MQRRDVMKPESEMPIMVPTGHCGCFAEWLPERESLWQQQTFCLVWSMVIWPIIPVKQCVRWCVEHTLLNYNRLHDH